MRLFSGPLSMFGAKVQIAAHEKNIDFELVMVPFTQKEGYAPKHPEVLRINPKRQVPVLIDGDLEIFNSTQIFEYFEDIKPHPALWPARLRQREPGLAGWSMKSDEVYFPHIIKLMPLWNTPDDPAAEARARGRCRLLPNDGARAWRPRVSRRRIFLCRYRVLYGPAVRCPHGAPT